MKKRMMSLLLTLCLIMSVLSFNVAAAETFTYKVSASTTSPSVGSEFDITFSLTNYAALESEIRALQIDIKNIDTSIFEVKSHSSLVNDSSAASNKTSYSSSGNYIRYIYMNMSGTMDKSVTDIMKTTLKVKDSLDSDGSVTLPVSIKIGTKSGNITLTDSLTINYKNSSADIVSVDISWGSMEFVYNDGEWDTANHKWNNSGWEVSENDSNLISVTNTGTVDVKIELKFTANAEEHNLTGNFTNSSDNIITSKVALAANGEKNKYWFHLQGTTNDRSISYVSLGEITLTISE